MPHTKTGFRHRSVYKIKQPHAFHFASQKFSFWVATMTLFAFVMGNMIGQHGWYAFWKSVLGAEDSMIVYTGTVTPIEYVPDYSRWAVYGGDPKEHTYRMVPKDLLVPLPPYDEKTQKLSYEDQPEGDVYSVGNMGSYEDGADGHGSHVGVDIRVPIDTPVRSIANGIVQTVREVSGGFGKYIVVRHPNVPDPTKPSKKTTIYSIYGHLNGMLVSEGDVVAKGEQIGLSGMTGFASGPHLHFQIDNDDAPWHPYWPFTSTEAADARMSFTQAINSKLHQNRGYEYTISPMLFVQRNLATSTVVAALDTTDTLSSSSSSVPMTPEERMLARRAERLKRLEQEKPEAIFAQQTSSLPTFSSSESSSSSVVTVATTDDSVLPHTPTVIEVSQGASVDHLEISHDGYFKRGWETVTIETRDTSDNVVKNPSFSGKVYLRAGFGDAEFRPSELTSADFKDGRAIVNVLPLGAKRSLVIETKGAFSTSAKTMEMQP